MAMVNVSTARKISIMARIAAQQAGRNRTVGAILQGARAITGSWGRILGQLWLEVTGLVFLFLAAIGAGALVREYNKYQVGQATSGRVLVAIIFTLTFAWFGVSSFWRVRKKS
jgi:hypothetical protein